MELKDMILSTLAELDDKGEKQESKPSQEQSNLQTQKEQNSEILTDEAIFLQNVKERVLVLFEGLQSPKNDNLETRLNITLNFLEFLLATIQERLEKIK